MRGAVLALAAALALTGCAGTPQSREAGSTLEVTLLAAQPQGDGLALAAVSGRSQALCRGAGPTPAAAVEALSAGGEQVVSAAHVEHLLLTRNGAGLLPALLDYAFRDPQQSTETQLWVLDGEDLAQSFRDPAFPARRMEVWKSAGRDRQGFCPVTLRQAAGAAAQGEPVLLPLLDPATLDRTGAVLWDGTAFSQPLDREEALGAALLLGQKVHWTASRGERACALRLTGCACRPRWTAGRLTGLDLRCRLEGVAVGGSAGAAEDWEDQTARAVRSALTALKRTGMGRLLLPRAGLAAPLSWPALLDQWDRAFPGLDFRVTARLRLGEERSGAIL